ncbi:MAG: sugar ABC transporter permease [Tyzzerella sp.]|nr:sugar ABC transporter permease [Tyzzerella sp.]
MKKKQKVKLLPYFLILPTVIGSVIFSFYPFFKTILSSFSVTDQYGSWQGWAGTTFWKMMFADKAFWQTLGTTMKFAVVIFIGTFFFAMLFALLSTKKTKMGKVSQMLYALPIAVAHATSSVIFRFAIKNGGLLNTWTGTDTAWLADENIAFWIVAIVTIWTHISGSYLYLLAGFRGVPEDIQEAAVVDGASGFTRAVKIMIPMASSQIFFVLFLNILSALKAFTQIRLLTSGGPNGSTTTFMWDIYQRAIDYGEYEYACCLAIVVFVIIFAVTRIQFAFEKKFVHYQ